MRVAQIRKMDISNGDGVGVSIFSVGCPYHCPNCHNKEIWSFDSGREYTQEDKNRILELIEPDYIKRLSILGGEPLLPQNVHALKDLIFSAKVQKPNIEVWLWTGTTVEAINQLLADSKCEDQALAALGWTDKSKRDLRDILTSLDYLIDGRFVDSKRDLTLKWRGSSNQRVLNRNELSALFDTSN